MRRGYALGLVTAGIILAIASLVQHTMGVVAVSHGALYLGASASVAVVGGTALWVVDRRSAMPGAPAFGPRGGSDGQGRAASTAMLGGRAHTRGIPYVLPRDLEEMNRLDFQHYILRQVFKGDFLAPVANPHAILDVGTGTGRWAREVATLFPAANVVGLDVNPPPVDEQAQASAMDRGPSNYVFVPGNILEGLPFADASFDFVHMRLLVLALPHDRWPFVVSELIRVTRPGGWVETVETTPVEHGGPAMDQIIRWTTTLLQRRGIDFMDGSRVGDLLQAQGLANVVSRRVELPMGAHGGRVGKLLATDILFGMQATRGPLVALGLTTAAEFDRALAEARRASESPQGRCISPFYVAYGQRHS
jgi:ubiquinone/menaquinone biosynthesis C-methylase UbiE